MKRSDWSILLTPDVGLERGFKKWRGCVISLFPPSLAVFFGTRDRDNWKRSETSLQHHAFVYMKRQDGPNRERKEETQGGKEEAGKRRERESGEWRLENCWALRLTLNAWQVCSRSHGLQGCAHQQDDRWVEEGKEGNKKYGNEREIEAKCPSWKITRIPARQRDHGDRRLWEQESMSSFCACGKSSM
jgi:hypothetical protein